MKRLKEPCPQILNIETSSVADLHEVDTNQNGKCRKTHFSEMDFDQQNLVSDEEMRNAFEEVDVSTIEKDRYSYEHAYELYIVKDNCSFPRFFSPLGKLTRGLAPPLGTAW